MDGQINKVHSSTIFCFVLSALMGFWEASISPSRRVQLSQEFRSYVAKTAIDFFTKTSPERFATRKKVVPYVFGRDIFAIFGT